MKITFFLAIIALIIGSCNKKNKEYTLEGRLMSTCDMPASNREMSLYQEATTLTSVGGHLKDFSSDENGYFKVTYIAENAGKLSIRANGVLIDGIPSREDINIGNVFHNPPAVNFVIRLQANNVYTANDTLYYYDWNYPQNGANHWVKKIAGPFQSGIIDTVANVGYMHFPIRYNGVNSMSVNYYINDYQGNKDANVTTPFCTNSFSEAILVLD